MRRSGALVSVAVALVAAGSCPPASADGDWALNGAYTATSNGEWAKKNDIFFDQASVRSTWTITTVCSYPTECTGTVTSDWGWSAPIYQKSGVWYVRRAVENWEPCPDGTAGPGLQIFRFSRPGAYDVGIDPTSTTLIGEDQTTGASGTCGISRPLFITMPFKLVKTG